jgi:SAM-dependent methyltransferase
VVLGTTGLGPAAGVPGLAGVVKDYYEELWRAMGEDLTPPDWELRRRFLLAEIGPGDRALDVGCGTGEFTAQMAQVGAGVVGTDVAEAALERARTRHRGLDFRITTIDGPLPFPDNSFDLVWASEVIEHIGDTARWLSEVRRVLTPAGRLLLTTPSHGRLRVALAGVSHFSEPLGDHLHLYTRGSLGSLLAEFDFDHISVRTAAGVPPLRRLLLARAVR